MALQDDLSDALAEIRRLTARIEKLERANPLENASITEGPGIRVGTPEGLRGTHKDSVSIEADEGLKIKPGASGKVDPGGKIALAGEIVGEGSGKVTVGGASMDPGSGGKVGAGGTWISADGGIRNDAGKITAVHQVEGLNGVKVGAAEMSTGSGGKVGAGGTWISADGGVRNDAGKITLVNQVDPLNGVLMTWGTGRHTLEQVTGWLQGDINSVSTRTTTAQNRADSAYSLADGKVSTTTLNNALAGKADALAFQTLQGQVTTLLGSFNALRAYVYQIHGSPGD